MNKSLAIIIAVGLMLGCDDAEVRETIDSAPDVFDIETECTGFNLEAFN